MAEMPGPTVLEHAVQDLEREGILSGPQAALLRRVYGRRLVSVYWELRVLLYAGIVTFTTGLGLLVHKNLRSFADLILLSGIGAGCTACFVYCFAAGGGFRRGQVPPPHAAYDYVLFLGCLLLGIGVGYLEVRYSVLAGQWSGWLLASGFVYLASAHYFDNRLVLSLALSTLGAWLGVRTSLFANAGFTGLYSWNGLLFGAAVVAAGAAQTRLGWKRHFLAVHLQLGLNVLFVALVSGVLRRDVGIAYLVGLGALSAGSALYALRVRQFSYLVYSVVYGYAGVTAFLMDRTHWRQVPASLYFLVTSGGVVWALVAFHRRFRSEE